MDNKRIIMDGHCSGWNKWDLHLHGNSTWLNNQYVGDETSDDNIVDAVVKSEIKVVGLTNYFNFREEDYELAEKLRNAGVVVFLNLELRFNQENKSREHINAHIIFNDGLNKEQINRFLSHLPLFGNSGGYCADLDNEAQLKSALVDVEQFFGYLNDGCELTRYRDFIIVGCSNGYGGFRPYPDDSRGSNVAMYFDDNSDAFFASSESPDADKDFFLSKRYEGSLPKPVFLASDAHDIAYIGEKFTWVKAKPSFDGLLQVLCNPKERIIFQENNPADAKNDGMIIDGIVCRDKIIKFSQDLNSIIGKRGNGKSILLKGIASKVEGESIKYKLGEERYLLDLEWLKKVYGNNFAVKWRDGEENAGTNENPKRIFYIPQGYLSNLAYDENSKQDERDKFIVSLLRRNVSFDNAEKNAKMLVVNTKKNIDGLIDDVVARSEEIIRLKQDNADMGSLLNLKNEFKKVNMKIKKLSDKFSIEESDNEKYVKAMAGKEECESALKIIKQDEAILERLFGGGSHRMFNIDDSALAGLSEKSKDVISMAFLEKSEEIQSEIVNEYLKELLKRREEKVEENKGYDEIINKLKPKFEQQKEISNLSAYKIEINRNIESIMSNNEKIKTEEKDLARLKKQIKEYYFSYRPQQEEIYKTVEFEKLNSIEINIKANLDISRFASFVDRNLNRNSLNGTTDFYRAFVNNEKRVLDAENFDDIFDDIFEGRATLLKGAGGNVSNVLKELLQNPYKIDFLESIKTRNTGTEFRNMTGGQKAITMLELIFNFDQNYYPVLIDQPEDDLDTDGIATTVVDFIKKQKEKRQIFIVSHNASLVVCADSEEIIVAEQKNINDFVYITGAIEDKEIKDKIIETLEGGEDALRLRMRKLHLGR